MFRRPKLNPELNVRLAKLIENYQAFAHQDPGTLRSLIPESDIWRFFCDKVVISNDGWLPFEKREQGYLEALYHGFNEIFNLETEFNSDYIKLLHSIALNQVNTSYSDASQSRGQFRSDSDSGTRFMLCVARGANRNISVEGIKEFLNKKYKFSYFNNIAIQIENCVIILNHSFIQSLKHVINRKDQTLADLTIDNLVMLLFDYCLPISRFKITKDKYIRSFLKNETVANNILLLIYELSRIEKNDQLARYIYQLIQDGSFEFTFISVQSKNTKEILEFCVNRYLFLYKQGIRKDNKLEKLSTIVEFIQACEQLHPFKDGNCRTLCMLLLNHLLLRNGFPLAILNNPNHFDLYSINELLEEVILGMENTFSLIREKELDSVKTSDILKILQNSQEGASALSYFDRITVLENLHRIHAREEAEKTSSHHQFSRRY